MNSTIHANQSNLTSVKDKTHVATAGAESDFWKHAEFNRFGIISVLLIVVACLGGLAAATAIERSTLQLVLVAIPVMIVESLILAVMPMRYIFLASLVSLIISLIVFIF
jgi:hypothetical protein